VSDVEITSKRLWLDDVRRPPSEGWVWARSVADALEILETGTVVEASLDNDLHPFEHDSLEVVEWMIEHQVFLVSSASIPTTSSPAPRCAASSNGAAIGAFQAAPGTS
jgi:hypothetical protein